MADNGLMSTLDGPLLTGFPDIGRCRVMGVVNVTPDSFSDGGLWLDPGKAVNAGAAIVNDVSGGLADPDMARVAAATGVPFVVMHWRGHSTEMEANAVYGDVVGEVVKEVHDRVEAVVDAGVAAEQIIVDPGLGFAKRREHDWALLSRIDALAALGRPVLVAASRKRFLGTLLADPETGDLRPARERDAATAAVSALAAAAGAWAVRVHDVRPTADAVRVEAAWRRAAEAGR
jgi:dihydropteroate synthase